ncbi:MAG: DUF5053 domain-containing protein [Alloprevotella sp.]
MKANTANTANTDKKVRQILGDIYEVVNLAYLSKNYFGKNRNWLYHQLSGTTDGTEDVFNEKDRQTLKEALSDIASRLNAAAEQL